MKLLSLSGCSLLNPSLNENICTIYCNDWKKFTRSIILGLSKSRVHTAVTHHFYFILPLNFFLETLFFCHNPGAIGNIHAKFHQNHSVRLPHLSALTRWTFEVRKAAYMEEIKGREKEEEGRNKIFLNAYLGAIRTKKEKGRREKICHIPGVYWILRQSKVGPCI